MTAPLSFFRQNGGQQDYTPGSAALAGYPVLMADGRASVVKTDLAASEKGAVYLEGIFDVKSASATTFSAGDRVFWDVSAELAITTPGASGDFYLGTAVAAKVNGDAYVRVDLNAVIGRGLCPVVESVSVAAPALLTEGLTLIDSTSNAVDGTLADGDYVGQVKQIAMIEASNSSTISIAKHETSDPEVATFDAVGEYLSLVWDGSQWLTVAATATFV